MRTNTNDLTLAIKRSGMKPPTKIVADGNRHKFIASKDEMGQKIHGYYITKDGVGLYWSKSLEISEKWSDQKVEQMTESEQSHYKKTLRELKRVRDKAIAKTGSGTKSDKQHSAHLEPAAHKKGAPVALRKNNDIPDRVARRLLNDCCTVIGNRSKVKTLRLLNLLSSSEDMPWYLFNSGKPIGVYHLSQMLARFHISSKNIRFKRGTAKGFVRNQFTEADRYMESLPES